MDYFRDRWGALPRGPAIVAGGRPSPECPVDLPFGDARHSTWVSVSNSSRLSGSRLWVLTKPRTTPVRSGFGPRAREQLQVVRVHRAPPLPAAKEMLNHQKPVINLYV